MKFVIIYRQDGDEKTGCEFPVSYPQFDADSLIISRVIVMAEANFAYMRNSPVYDVKGEDGTTSRYKLEL